MTTTPSNLESGGASLAARATVEDEYARIVEDEVFAFLNEMQREAYRAASSGSTAALAVAALTLWAAAYERLVKRLPSGSVLLAAFRDSQLPEQATLAAQQQLALSASLGLSIAETRARVTTSLGLADDPVKGLGGKYGRLLLDPEGNRSTSWEGESAALARTSATADYGSSMIEELRRQGYTHKRWMTRYDSRVRETHADVDRATIELDEVFLVGGSALRYPADPMGAADQTINCRCVLAGVKFGRHKLDHPEGTEPWNNPRPVG